MESTKEKDDNDTSDYAYFADEKIEIPDVGDVKFYSVTTNSIDINSDFNI